jgi:hypothetical protein
MTWTKKYWEIIDYLYWVPSYIGLKSIPQKLWNEKEDMICIPKSKVNMSGPIYTRDKKIKDFMPYVRRIEEMFNNIFDLVFAILPEDVNAEIWSRCTGEEYKKPLKSFGLNIRPRYGWTEHENITQVDGYFISEETVLSVELKFNAKTSRDQLVKYIYLMMLEEKYAGKKKQVHLLYIFNKTPYESLQKQLDCAPENIADLNPRDLQMACKNKKVCRYVEEHFEDFQDILKRLKLFSMDYTEFTNVLSTFSKMQQDDVGGRTLKRLLEGLIYETEVHPLSNVKLKA